MSIYLSLVIFHFNSVHGIKNLMLLDRSQTEISNNKGKCFKKEKVAGYFHDNVLITTNSALL